MSFLILGISRKYRSEVCGTVPLDMIPEQRIVRSYKVRDKPEGFPYEYRKYALYGKQIGRAGRPTFFYSEVI